MNARACAVAVVRSLARLHTARQGACALAAVLPNAPALIELLLGHNRLGDTAAHALATLCQLRLAWLGRKGGGGGGVAQASAQAAGPKKVRAATPRARAASPKARAASPARSSRDRRSPQRKKKTL